MYTVVRTISPPLGFGKNCPYTVACKVWLPHHFPTIPLSLDPLTPSYLLGPFLCSLPFLSNNFHYPSKACLHCSKACLHCPGSAPGQRMTGLWLQDTKRRLLL